MARRTQKNKKVEKPVESKTIQKEVLKNIKLQKAVEGRKEQVVYSAFKGLQVIRN